LSSIKNIKKGVSGPEERDLGFDEGGDGCLEEKGQQWWVQGHNLLVVSPLGILVKIVVTPDLDPF